MDVARLEMLLVCLDGMECQTPADTSKPTLDSCLVFLDKQSGGTQIGKALRIAKQLSIVLNDALRPTISDARRVTLDGLQMLTALDQCEKLVRVALVLLLESMTKRKAACDPAEH